MTQREEFEKWFFENGFLKSATIGEKMLMLQAWKAAKAQAVPEGWRLVPVEPTPDQFGGMARDIIQWLRFTESKDQHSESLNKWIKDMGNEIPDWLYSEPEVNHLSKHVLSKGTIAAIIYKSMLDAAPEQNK